MDDNGAPQVAGAQIDRAEENAKSGGVKHLHNGAAQVCLGQVDEVEQAKDDAGDQQGAKNAARLLPPLNHAVGQHCAAADDFLKNAGGQAAQQGQGNAAKAGLKGRSRKALLKEVGEGHQQPKGGQGQAHAQVFPAKPKLEGIPPAVFDDANHQKGQGNPQHMVQNR